MKMYHTYKSMIRALFKKGWEGCKLDTYEFNEFFMYRYPGYDEKKYYFNTNLITGPWQHFMDIQFSQIYSIADDTYNESGFNNNEKPIIYIDDVYMMLNVFI